ncbi:flagellar biosynthetic protein FliO [Paraburkholderia dinghuensis]|uniref:Flagellar protein n=2 Tax=Paraburkholderia dinghuensis TaxID=2305225 RepID=A0A3N6PVC1_9BURK|nr:flagellar biosynthetic protein FliO [Paraburkholderia dinghuensis]RQH06180.1 flagellar biosynthetic protein FliO [Paraburkholderia dinghuensis]
MEPAKAFASSAAIVSLFATLAIFAATPLAARAADLNAINQAALAASGASAPGATALGAGSAVPALGFGAVMQTVFGLAIVIGLVFGCAWLARRLGLQGGPRNALVKTIGGASLGGKERVAVVEIGDTWLVLGAAPGNVRLLHTMPAGTVPDTAQTSGTPGPALQGSFGRRFRDALKDEAGKRFRRHAGGAQ